MFKTKYFDIYYDKNSIKEAKELIRVADNIAEAEAKLFKMEIPKNIKVYVMDTQDNANAFSTGFGIHLFVTNNGAITNEYKNYIPYLFSHELTHELLDYKITGNGFNKYIPLTDQIVKSATIPRWWTEGMAVLIESMISQGGGRTFDPAFIAIAKRDLNENKFNGLGPTYYNSPYEYGNSFLRFYLETYGIDKISEAIDYYSKHKIGGIGRSFGKVAGVDADTLHKQWMNFLTKITNDVKGDLVEGPSIFDVHSYNAQVIKDGNNIWTYQIEKREDASITAGHTRHSLKFLKIPFDDGIKDNDWNPNYKDVKEYSAPLAIIGNQPAIKGNDIYYSSYPAESTFRGSEDNIAYRYNLETEESTILKDLNRPDKFVNVGGKIYYTFLQDGSTGISTLSNQVLLAPGKYSISSMNDAGKNRMLFTAKIRGEQGSKIFLLDLTTKKVKFLINGKSAFLATEEINKDKDSVAKESVTKEVLYFTDNFGEEVNNVYKKDLNSNNITKITNVLYNAKSPIIINNKLVYLNFTTNGNSISTLDMEYAVNEDLDLKTLEKERNLRHKKYSNLYGEYGKAYNPNITTDVTTEILENNNDNKEIKGFYFPDFTKPSLTVSNYGVGVKFNSANLNTTLSLSYEASSFYTGVGGYITPDLGLSKDITSKQRGTLPLYWTMKKSGSKTDQYSLSFIHSFSSFSGAQFGFFHTEYVTHGVSYGNLDSKNKAGDKYRTHADEMFLTIPFNIPALDKAVYFTVHTFGDFQNDDMKGSDKIWNNKVKLEFGYDSYGSYLIGDAKTKFGMVIKNKKNSFNSGNNGTNYFYVDRDIKSDIPYMNGLSFLNLRTRLYFAPNEFSDNDTSLTQLTASGLGYYSVGGNSDDVRTFITNAKFAGKLYGDMNYTIPIEYGSNFGMVYLRNLQLRLGYSYTGFMDEDYKGRASTLSYYSKTFPGMVPYLTLSTGEISAKLDTVVKDFKTHTDVRALGLAIATALGAPSAQDLVIAVAIGEKRLQDAATTDKIKNIFATDPSTAAITRKTSEEIVNITNANYVLSNNMLPKKEKKFRHGMTINPSISLNGNLFNDSADFELSVGNTYMAEFTDSILTDTDFSYISASFRF